MMHFKRTIAVSFLSLWVVCFTFAQEPAVQWLSWDEAAKKMEKEPRKIMVDAYTDWCGWCKRMDATTMQDPVIVKVLNENFYAVKLDGEYKNDITFKGRTYKFVPVPNRRGYHELPAEIMGGKMSYPTLVFMDEQYGIIQVLPGYRDAKGLEGILAFFGTNAYKSSSWDDFMAKFKSAIN